MDPELWNTFSKVLEDGSRSLTLEWHYDPSHFITTLVILIFSVLFISLLIYVIFKSTSREYPPEYDYEKIVISKATLKELSSSIKSIQDEFDKLETLREASFPPANTVPGPSPPPLLSEVPIGSLPPLIPEKPSFLRGKDKSEEKQLTRKLRAASEQIAELERKLAESLAEKKKLELVVSESVKTIQQLESQNRELQEVATMALGDFTQPKSVELSSTDAVPEAASSKEATTDHSTNGKSLERDSTSNGDGEADAHAAPRKGTKLPAGIGLPSIDRQMQGLGLRR